MELHEVTGTNRRHGMSIKTYYVAKVIEDEDDEDDSTSATWSSAKCHKAFNMPQEPDLGTIRLKEVKLLLLSISFENATARQSGLYKFKVDFSQLRMD